MHLQRHEGVRRFLCEHCQASFLTTSDFKRHMRTHTGSCSNIYFCPLQHSLHLIENCISRIFSLALGDNNALCTISGEKPYKCNFCQQTFGRAERAQEHINQHHLASTSKSKHHSFSNNRLHHHLKIQLFSRVGIARFATTSKCKAGYNSFHFRLGGEPASQWIRSCTAGLERKQV